jgi:hypothetical protein
MLQDNVTPQRQSRRRQYDIFWSQPQPAVEEFLRCWPAIVSSGGACASVGSMDKKEINSTKMTLNFLVWIGGVFMLLLFALLAHFVWRLF